MIYIFEFAVDESYQPKVAIGVEARLTRRHRLGLI